MGFDINRVQIMGRVGGDPESKAFDGGNKVANFSVATDESYTDRNNQKVDRTEWHKVQAWGGWADQVMKWVTKGTKVFVEGKLATRSWEKDGRKHYMTEIVLEKLVVMQPPRNAPGQAAPAAQPVAQPQQVRSGPGLQPGDDLPF